jgi:lipoprotein-anchoring transpeptidase ErfK/SrfK
MQDLLFIHGFLNGISDGIYGSETEGAIIEFIRYLNQAYAAKNRDDPVLQRYPLKGNSLSPELLSILESGESFPVLDEMIRSGDSGLKVTRIQRRLTELGYMIMGADGVFGDITGEALTYFQQLNGIERTGVADVATQRAIFSGSAIKSDKQLRMYKLVVDVSDQRVYAYKWNEAINDYDTQVRAMVCSTGKKATPTPLGKYQDSTGPGARWHYFKKFNCWAQYAFAIEGDILFHSVLYGTKGGKVQQSSVNNLGKRASHGCVRLSVEDARWIYENCTFGTPVVVRN